MLNDPRTGNPSIPFTLYAIDCENKYEKMMKTLREQASWSPVDRLDVIQAAETADLNEPTSEEIEQILQEVNKFWL